MESKQTNKGVATIESELAATIQTAGSGFKVIAHARSAVQYDANAGQITTLLRALNYGRLKLSFAAPSRYRALYDSPKTIVLRCSATTHEGDSQSILAGQAFARGDRMPFRDSCGFQVGCD